MINRLLAGALASIALCTPVIAATQAADSGGTGSLIDLSIEELMNESVTSVAKKAMALSQAPAAITVITQDDFRRLGITLLPEALRLVPGMNVARVNASQWAISSRGFNSTFANKLLVLQDGRSIYTPSFGGVFWDVQDMLLEDLDRIEVIRGPGATLWGANAVNGVINITSKDARATQGLLISGAAGSEDQPGVGVRYGGRFADDLYYRVYAKYFDREGFEDFFGNDTPDDWESARLGFRADWEPVPDRHLTVQGDYYALDRGENVYVPLLAPPYAQSFDIDDASHGANILARWTSTLSDRSYFSVQAYFDYFLHDANFTEEQRHTADVEFEHRFPIGPRNDLIWGLGYRFTTDELRDSPFLFWDPERRDLDLFTAFVQDEIALWPERFSVTLGSKFEHNEFTGWEIQPSARFVWTPNERHAVWAAVSRAVSTPPRGMRDNRYNFFALESPFGPPVLTAFFGSDATVSEELMAYELGYRVEPASNLALDISAFYNDYDQLASFTPGAPAFELDPAPHLLFPLNWANEGEGETYGVEATVQWQPLDRWRLTGTYSYLEMNLKPDASAEWGNPRHQATLRSYLALPHDVEFNAAAYYVDTVAFNVGFPLVIPDYLRFDLGFTWRPTESIEVGVWGQNLLDAQHPEYLSFTTLLGTEVPRSVMARASIRY
jgi:iron complex outermembrane receptor protein